MVMNFSDCCEKYGGRYRTDKLIRMGELQSILKVDPHDTPEVDSSILFSIPYESVYLFDGETEMVIK